MHLEPNEVQIWSTALTLTPEQEEELFASLSEEERLRARRFQSPVHQQRFIKAHGTLRQLLSQYLQIAPNDIQYSYTEHHKPHLHKSMKSTLQFNMAHSHDMAVYAFTLGHPVGIDIEKIQTKVNDQIAKRYFSAKENAELNSLPNEEKTRAFYHIWAKKEAVIKAIGQGLLTVPLSSFSVSSLHTPEIIYIENEKWSLIPIFIKTSYASAFATNQIVHKVSYSDYYK